MKKIAVLLHLTFTTSCTSIHYIAPNHWNDLDGYRDPPPKKTTKRRPKNTVRDKHNHRLKIDRTTPIVIRTKPTSKSPIIIRGKGGSKKIETTYRAIDFGKTFSGVATRGGKVEIERNQIKKLGVRQTSIGKTTALVVILVVVTAFVVGTIAVATCDSCGGGGGDDD